MMECTTEPAARSIRENVCSFLFFIVQRKIFHQLATEGEENARLKSENEQKGKNSEINNFHERSSVGRHRSENDDEARKISIETRFFSLFFSFFCKNNFQFQF